MEGSKIWFASVNVYDKNIQKRVDKVRPVPGGAGKGNGKPAVMKKAEKLQPQLIE
jgi:hypothetical protein